MKTLLTFTGFQGPYAVGLVGQEQQAGPILSIAMAMPFGRIFPFSTPAVRRHTQETVAAMKSSCPHTGVTPVELPLQAPTDYIPILRHVRQQTRAILTNGSQSGAARMLGISPQAVHKFLREEK